MESLWQVLEVRGCSRHTPASLPPGREGQGQPGPPCAAAPSCDPACRLPHAQADGLGHGEDLPDEGLVKHQPQHQGDRADPARLRGGKQHPRQVHQRQVHGGGLRRYPPAGGAAQTAISGGGGAQALLSWKPKALSVVPGTFLHSANNLDHWPRARQCFWPQNTGVNKTDEGCSSK